MRRVLLVVVLMSLSLFAQESRQHVNIELKTASITGADDYTITKTADGFTVSGMAKFQTPRGPIEMTYEQLLGPDWSVKKYTLNAKVGGAEQKIEVARNGETINMVVQANGQTVPKDAVWSPHTVVLDNLIASHFQVLLNSLAAAKSDAFGQWQFVIPQRLTAATGKISAGQGAAEGTLNGKPVKLKKVTVEIGATLLEVSADAATNHFLRMNSPVQQYEMTMEGFVPTETKQLEASSNCTERKETFRSDKLDFPTVVCIPKTAINSAKLPIVVLVHGSGPHDPDETVGPNKPFRDIAEGFAAAGIASVRYEKRTHFAKSSINPATFTVQDETVTDAVNALKFAAKLPEADPTRIFVLGHSLGGSMAPFIAEQAANTRGVILMAAAAVPLDETIERQLTAQLRATGAKQEDIEAQLVNLKEQFAAVRSGKVNGEQVVFGAPAHYGPTCFNTTFRLS